MFVTINGVEHRISFFHGIGEFEFKRREYDPETDRFIVAKVVEEREFCKCFITTGRDEERKTIYEGISICHPIDLYDKELGRKIALTDALSQIDDRELRRRFWKVYLGRREAPRGELQQAS